MCGQSQATVGLYAGETVCFVDISRNPSVHRPNTNHSDWPAYAQWCIRCAGTHEPQLGCMQAKPCVLLIYLEILQFIETFCVFKMNHSKPHHQFSTMSDFICLHFLFACVICLLRRNHQFSTLSDFIKKKGAHRGGTVSARGRR